MSQVVIDGPLEVGAVAKIRQPKLPATAWTVTEVVPGRSFSWESKAPGSLAVGEHEITPTGDATCEVRLMLDQTGPVREPGRPPLPGPDQALRPDGGRRPRRRGHQVLRQYLQGPPAGRLLRASTNDRGGRHDAHHPAHHPTTHRPAHPAPPVGHRRARCSWRCSACWPPASARDRPPRPLQSQPTRATRPATPTTSTAPATEADEADEAALDAAEKPVDFDVDLVDGDADPGDPDGSDFGDGGASADPCADHDPADGNLLVGPDPLVLPSGEMDGEIHVRNCGTEDVAWSAATKPSVSLATAGGTLDPGEVFPIELTIDGSQWEPGAIEFKVRVTEGEFVNNTYVDVHAFRPMTGADMVASDELSAGPARAGAASSASPRPSSAPATAAPTSASTSPPPCRPRSVCTCRSTPPRSTTTTTRTSPASPPKATSPNGVTSWKTSLAGLQATTKYFIIVKATDGDGDTAYRHGSFKTITPVQQDGGLRHGRRRARLLQPVHHQGHRHPRRRSGPGQGRGAHAHPGDHPADAVHQGADHQGRSPALRQEGRVAHERPRPHRGVGRPGERPAAGHQVLRHHHRHRRQRAPLVRHRPLHHRRRRRRSSPCTTCTWWATATTAAATEASSASPGASARTPRASAASGRCHSNSNISFADHESTYVVHDATGNLPEVRAVAFERDADGKVEFCTGGFGAMYEPGSDGSCDWKWNVAASPTVRAGDLAQLPDCEGMGIEGSGADGCLRIESQDMSGDYAAFWAIVSYTYLD